MSPKTPEQLRTEIEYYARIRDTSRSDDRVQRAVRAIVQRQHQLDQIRIVVSDGRRP